MAPTSRIILTRHAQAEHNVGEYGQDEDKAPGGILIDNLVI